MNRDDYFNNGNNPPGFEDPGIIHKGRGKSFLKVLEERQKEWDFYKEHDVPLTPGEADARRNKQLSDYQKKHYD